MWSWWGVFPQTIAEELSVKAQERPSEVDHADTRSMQVAMPSTAAALKCKISDSEV